MLLGALGYALASVPLLLFVRMPSVPARFVVAYGLLFVAIRLRMAAGVASLVLQTQIMLTLLLAAIFLGERTRGVHWVGFLLASDGLGLIVASRGDGSGEMSPIGFLH